MKREITKMVNCVGYINALQVCIGGLEDLNENKEILFVYSSIRYNQYWPADVQTNAELVIFLIF